MKKIRLGALLLTGVFAVSAVPAVHAEGEMSLGEYEVSDGFVVEDVGTEYTDPGTVDTSVSEYSVSDQGELYAAASTWPATRNIKTYAKSTKNDTRVYKTSTSKDSSYGCVYASDLVTIKGYENGRYHISYPISKGTKEGWVAESDITAGAFNVTKSKYQAKSKITTYRRKGGGAELGYVSKGDTVYVIATSGNYKQIIYPLDAGGYKMGWIYEDPNNSSNSSGALADTAANEVGYRGNGDYTKYGEWFGNNGVPWCAIFVSYCVNKAGVSTRVVPKKAACNDMKNSSNSYKKWSSSALSSIKKNDVIFFSTGSQDSHHVGIVYSVDRSNNKITVIEGNTSSDTVKKNTYTVNSNSGKITKGWNGHYFCGYIAVN